MSLVPPWQKRYLIGAQSTSISTAVDFTSASAIGIKTGEFLWKPTNLPFLTPNQQIIDQSKQTGLSVRRTTEFALGIQTASITVEFEVNANILTLLFWSLFQGGFTEAVGTPFVKTGIPYTSGSASVWLSLAEIVSTSTAGENKIADGGICTSLTLSGSEESQTIAGSADIMFASYTNSHDASSDVLTDPAITSLLYKNMDVTFAGDAINIPSFELTITNNAAVRFFHSTTAVKDVLGMLEVTGNIVVPRDSGNSNHDDLAVITDLINLTDNTLTLYWGNTPASANGDLSLIINALDTSVDEVTEIELGHQVNFSHAYDGSNDISFTLADSIDRGI